MKNVTSDKCNLWMFPIGTVGRDMIYNLFTNFIFTYILFTRNLTAAQLGAVTAIMVGARVFDALNDPVMGNIIERTRSRYGKFKPWLVIGILSTSVVVYLAFNTSLQGWSFIAFFGVIYFLYSITYTMHDISYWGMVSALSSDAHVRDALTSRTNLFAGIGGVAASILIPMLTTGSGTLGGSTATAYGRVALVICILAPLFLCATIFGVRERRDYNTKEVPPVSFKKILDTITGNPQILWISLIFLLQQMGNDVVVGGLGSTYVYFAFGYEGGLYSLFNTVGLAATALLMIFYPALAKRIRRKQMMDKLMLLSVIGYVVMLGAGLFPGSGMVKFWVLTAGYMVANLGQYGFYLIMMISLINTVEYNEYLRGEREARLRRHCGGRVGVVSHFRRHRVYEPDLRARTRRVSRRDHRGGEARADRRHHRLHPAGAVPRTAAVHDGAAVRADVRKLCAVQKALHSRRGQIRRGLRRA